MGSPNVRLTIKLLNLVAVASVFTSCVEVNMNKMAKKSFSSLASEQRFWSQWIKDKDDTTCPLEPFFTEDNKEKLKQVDEKLIAQSAHAEAFLLIVRTSINNGILEIVSLTKRGNKWKQVSWEDTGDDALKNTVASITLGDSLFDHLDSVWVDVTDRMVLDGESVYVFLERHGKYHRFAIYNPEFTPERKKQGDPEIAFLEKLFRKIGFEY